MLKTTKNCLQFAPTRAKKQARKLAGKIGIIELAAFGAWLCSVAICIYPIYSAV